MFRRGFGRQVWLGVCGRLGEMRSYESSRCAMQRRDILLRRGVSVRLKDVVAELRDSCFDMRFGISCWKKSRLQKILLRSDVRRKTLF